VHARAHTHKKGSAATKPWRARPGENCYGAAMSGRRFASALVKFNRSQSDDSPYEHLVDLPTALGAALIGAERGPIHAPWDKVAFFVLRCEN
jgi:hypothetical protein